MEYDGMLLTLLIAYSSDANVDNTYKSAINEETLRASVKDAFTLQERNATLFGYLT
jgi:hypothetical protein